ncbi:MAG: D-sedoheptulose-7-phosphate isomerase [Pseudobdellovibrionaceae bacterium]
MDYKNFISDSFKKSANNLTLLAENKTLQSHIAEAAELIVNSYKNKGRLFIAGNGGSAADAQHIAAEMVGKLAKDRTSLAAYAMNTNNSSLTAIGNDYGYDFVFSRQVQGLMRAEDVFLAITTSGNSVNIIKALEEARKLGCKSILLSGKDGGNVVKNNLADVVVLAPGEQTAHIQEAHIVIYHTICFAIENALIESGHAQYF